jgi:pyrroloquinoline quinone biosynthesis protein D
MNTQSIPALSPLFRFQWEEVQQCHVILYPEGMVKLSGSAGEVMKQVDGQSDVATIIQTLSDLFDGADVGDDVISFLNEAEKNDWIQFK